MVSPERSVNWVVLAPPRNRAVAPDGVVNTPATEIVVLAVPPKVETPVTPSVPLVKMLVLMVVAAWTTAALPNITARERTRTRAPLPRLFRYVLMLFITVVKIFTTKMNKIKWGAVASDGDYTTLDEGEWCCLAHLWIRPYKKQKPPRRVVFVFARPMS